MNKHNWECISPGEYDSTYKCKKCGELYTLQSDNIESKLPEDGCEIEDDFIEQDIAFFKMEYGMTTTSTNSLEGINGYVRLTEYKTLRIKKLSREEVVKKMVDDLDAQAKTEMAEHEVKMNVIKDKKAKLLSIGYDGNDICIDEIPF